MTFDPLNSSKFNTPSGTPIKKNLQASKELNDISKLFSSNINKDEEKLIFSTPDSRNKLKDRNLEEISLLKKQKLEEFKAPVTTPLSRYLPTPDMWSSSPLRAIPSFNNNFNSITPPLNSNPVPQTPKKASPGQRFLPNLSNERSPTNSTNFSQPTPPTPKKSTLLASADDPTLFAQAFNAL